VEKHHSDLRKSSGEGKTAAHKEEFMDALKNLRKWDLATGRSSSSRKKGAIWRISKRADGD